MSTPTLDRLIPQCVVVAPAFMPDGRPAPAILSEDDVIAFLRIEGKAPKRTLKYWRQEGMLTPTGITAKPTYRLDDVLAFAKTIAERTSEKNTMKLRAKGLVES